jgi:hypothetical protein
MKTDNKSLHWIFTSLRYVKTSELKPSPAKINRLFTLESLQKGA